VFDRLQQRCAHPLARMRDAGIAMRVAAEAC
jgi:hypothetical protein